MQLGHCKNRHRVGNKCHRKVQPHVWTTQSTLRCGLSSDRLFKTFGCIVLSIIDTEWVFPPPLKEKWTWSESTFLRNWAFLVKICQNVCRCGWFCRCRSKLFAFLPNLAALRIPGHRGSNFIQINGHTILYEEIIGISRSFVLMHLKNANIRILRGFFHHFLTLLQLPNSNNPFKIFQNTYINAVKKGAVVKIFHNTKSEISKIHHFQNKMVNWNTIKREKHSALGDRILTTGLQTTRWAGVWLIHRLRVLCNKDSTCN